MFKSLVVVGFIIVLTGCSGSSSGGGSGSGNGVTPQAEIEKCQNSTANYSYIYSENINGSACTTNCRQFYSKSELCAGLMNHALNNNCALEARKEAFQEACN